VVPKEHLEVLEPLTAEELARCTLEAINDWFDHVRSRHPFEKPGSTTMLQHVLEQLVENPEYAAAVARQQVWLESPPMSPRPTARTP
jgi:hypothetical protein